MWIRFPGGAAPRGGRPVASEQRWVALVCDDHCSLFANHLTNESSVNAVRQWRVLAAKGSGAVDILFAARPSGDAMPTTRDAASARIGKERMALGYSNGLRPTVPVGWPALTCRCAWRRLLRRRGRLRLQRLHPAGHRQRPAQLTGT